MVVIIVYISWYHNREPYGDLACKPFTIVAGNVVLADADQAQNPLPNGRYYFAIDLDTGRYNTLDNTTHIHEESTHVSGVKS